VVRGRLRAGDQRFEILSLELTVGLVAEYKNHSHQTDYAKRDQFVSDTLSPFRSQLDQSSKRRLSPAHE